MTQVYVIEQNELAEIETSSSTNIRNEDDATTTIDAENLSNPDSLEEDDGCLDLEQEKEQHEWNTNTREEAFKKIILGLVLQFSWSKFVFRIIGTITMCCVLTTPIWFIPAHNIFHHPYYWYESLLQAVPFATVSGVSIPCITGYLMNINYIRRFRCLLTTFLEAILGNTATYVLCYVVWTYILKLQYPIPFMGYFVSYIFLCSIYITIWFQFPLKSRENIVFRRRLRYCMTAFFYSIVINIEYNIAAKI